MDQFRFIKIQPKTIHISTRLWGIISEFVGFIPQSLVLRSVVLGWILIYRNWSIQSTSVPVSKLNGVLAAMRTIMNAVTKKKNIIESYVDYGSPKIWYWQIRRFAARGFNFLFHIVVLDVTLQLSLVFNLSR